MRKKKKETWLELTRVCLQNEVQWVENVSLTAFFHTNYKVLSKGQTISEWIYEAIVSPKIRTKNCQNFCPVQVRAEILTIFVRILEETMTSQIHYKVNWPLVKEKMRKMQGNGFQFFLIFLMNYFISRKFKELGSHF